jgi:hypothetical protein
VKLGSQDPLVGKRPKEDFNGIQGDPLGADGIDGMPQADEQALQIIIPGFFNLIPFYTNIIDN